MHVRFWGTRGSIAAPGQSTARYGGNTSCVEVRAADGTLIVLDCGTGSRELGLHLIRTMAHPLRMHLFIGHTHWDHIQGFPFFAPAFLANAEVNIYAPLGFQRSLEGAMAGQMEASYFPVKLRDLRSRLHFTELDEGFFRVGDVLVETQYLNHTAPTIAYRITSGDASVAYVTDHEPFWRSNGQAFDHPGDRRHIAFLQGADLVIHDAQYTEEEYQSRQGWGHSPIEYATDVAMAAGARRLALFHHDPGHDDETVAWLEARAQARVTSRAETLEVFAAAEGLEVEVRGNGTVHITTGASALRRLPIIGRRVVIVSNDEAEISSIERELAEDALVLLSIPDAKTALSRVAEIGPDVLIISSRLPDADGQSLIAPLRERTGRRDFPVVLLMDDATAAFEPRSEAVPTDYLVRPFSPPMLRARVRAWLSRTLLLEETWRTAAFDDSLVPAWRAGTAGLAAEGREDSARAKYASLLMSMPLFRPLKRRDFEALAEQAVDQVYAAGHAIVREGSPSESLFVVLSGRVRITETAGDNQSDLVIGELGPGEIFGEIGILRNRPRNATVVALDRTHCLVLQPANFVTAVENSPELALNLMQVLAARLSDADRRLARYAPDSLTGLMSRRAFQDQYRRVAAGARRRRTGLLVLLLDVLHLKTLNDRFGYAYGDEVLKGVADVLTEATRTTDLIARYGGDEFAVLLVDAEERDTDLVVARFEKKLAEVAPRRQLRTPVRCSIGVAFTGTPPDAPDGLFAQADDDMNRRRAEA